MPSLVLAIVLSAVLSRGLSTIIIAIGVTCWAHTARVVRAQTLTIETRPYIERSRALGAGDRHIIGKHVFPSVLPLVMANTTLVVGQAIILESTLAFLGLGDPTTFSVGLDAQDRARHRCGDGRLLVVRALARHRDRHRRAVLHPRGSRPRSRAQPDAEGPLMTDQTPTLAWDDVRITYAGGTVAVDGVSLEIERGGTVGLAGESGCGKSTLAMSVLRLLPRSARIEGRILLQGEDVAAMTWGRLRAVRWTEAAIVFQGAMHSLNPVRQVRHQVAEALALHSTRSSPTRRRGCAGSTSCWRWST